MGNPAFVEKMRKSLSEALQKEQKKSKPDKKTIDDLRAKYAEWDLNARNNRVK